ncbi:DUF2092 domain-containing protein [uncultured Algibacter sp.]|uniref:DUF2092 domain-containing protein n=1 Tax=uncultured Algibacter sp. TaxID=298659 RepID=UPI00260C41F2|nr:DUF2092 domain-containing protein [uncultured Algibacter sp.]
MKKVLILCILCAFSLRGISQTSKKIDSTAIFVLDKMTDIIGNLSSVSFDLETSNDRLDSNKNIIKNYSKSTVTFSGPDKLFTRTDGSKGKMGFWYDGSFMTYYNYDENNYVTLEAPETTLEMIDQMHNSYDFKFPAADFFYPDFTDHIMEYFDEVKFLGKKTLSGEECYHIMAINKEMNVQFWISNKTHLLPKHFVIIYKNKNNMQYESTFSNWSLNPNVPDAVFNFLAPPSAKLISILKKS